jgi:hypothetical protein
MAVFCLFAKTRPFSSVFGFSAQASAFFPSGFVLLARVEVTSLRFTLLENVFSEQLVDLPPLRLFTDGLAVTGAFVAESCVLFELRNSRHFGHVRKLSRHNRFFRSCSIPFTGDLKGLLHGFRSGPKVPVILEYSSSCETSVCRN